MDLYAGLAGDKPQGGGSYVEEEGFGHEVFNFMADDDGRFRGYVRPPRGGRIHIERLGAAAGAKHVSCVTVFWAATNPIRGGTCVVGWYDNATVYRDWKPSSKKTRLLPNGDKAGFVVEAPSTHLISSDDRLLDLPRANAKQTGIGQANVWYPPPEWAKKLLDYRKAVMSGNPLGPGPPPPVKPGVAHAADTEARLRIERAAMKVTIAWCEQRGLPWKDVSLQRLGWDVEAGQGKALLRIEVKGSSLPLGAAFLELTPNEFAKMKEHRGSFRLAVVSIVNDKPMLAMFAWSQDGAAWIADKGALSLKVHEILAARVEVVKGHA
jgi:hypothetical protein